MLSHDQAIVIENLLDAIVKMPPKHFNEKIGLISAKIIYNEDISELYLFRSLYYKANRQDQLAKIDAQKAQELCPNLAVAYYNLGVCYQINGLDDSKDEASKCYEAALKIDANFREASRNLARCEGGSDDEYSLMILYGGPPALNEKELAIKNLLNQAYEQLQHRQSILKRDASETADFTNYEKISFFGKKWNSGYQAIPSDNGAIELTSMDVPTVSSPSLTRHTKFD